MSTNDDTKTDRQRYWLDAAREDAKRGNACAAIIFAFIAQPSDAERKAERRREGGSR